MAIQPIERDEARIMELEGQVKELERKLHISEEIRIAEKKILIQEIEIKTEFKMRIEELESQLKCWKENAENFRQWGLKEKELKEKVENIAFELIENIRFLEEKKNAATSRLQTTNL